LLQLVPGLYLVLLFISFLFLVYFSNLWLLVPFKLDNDKSLGTKTINRTSRYVIAKTSLSLFLIGLVVTLNTVIPLSLDSFNSYGERSLENIWSFEDVIGLEITLLIILIVLCQIPIVVVSIYTNEKDANLFPEVWRILSLIIFILSGILTPTIDGYTQLAFSASAVSLYLIIISLIEKRVNTKYSTTLSLGS
jgi:Sec-independent protein secretion pathway component TatC